jgi:hypothetical protein
MSNADPLDWRAPLLAYFKSSNLPMTGHVLFVILNRIVVSWFPSV